MSTQSPRHPSQNLRYAEGTIMAGLLHHVAEEWDVTDDRIRRIFGDLVADGVDTVTKTYRGHRQDDTTLFERMAENPISSVARPADRATNHGSMVDVFSREKLGEYIENTGGRSCRVLKKVKRTFPDQSRCTRSSS